MWITQKHVIGKGKSRTGLRDPLEVDSRQVGDLVVVVDKKERSINHYPEFSVSKWGREHWR
jgi:hypothetical protein